MILTLPISIRKIPTLGYWLTPVVGDVLRRRTKDNYRIIVGTLGSRAPQDDEVLEFRNTLNKMNVGAEVVFDADMANDLANHALRFLDRSQVKMVREQCYVCSCGALELPCEQTKYLKQKTFKVNELGAICCTRCGDEATQRTLERAYVFFNEAICEYALHRSVLAPEFYRKELHDLMKQIKEYGVCVSRNRETGFLFGNINMDVEFVWQALLCLQEDSKNVLVVNNHVLRQALISMLIAKTLNTELDVETLILPYLHYPEQNRLEKWRVTRLLNLGHDASTLRFMLMASLHWHKKDCDLRPEISQVEYRRFNLLRRLVSETPFFPEDALFSFVRDFNQQSLSQGLKHVFNPGNFDYRKLYGLW